MPRVRKAVAHLGQNACNLTPPIDRITFDLLVMGGRACIRGLRIPVSVIVSQIAHGATVDEVLADYPDLDREDVQEALRYAGEPKHGVRVR
jgi:uncharacterized protein (DUF433 family)